MCRKTACFVLGVGILIAITVPNAFAQYERAEGTVFLEARIGLGAYVGDRASPPGVELEDPFFGFPALGGTIGYQFTHRWGLGLGLLWGTYPRTTRPPIEDDSRTSLQLLLNYFLLPSSTLSPYLLAGGNVTWGSDYGGESTVGYGPTVGAGLDLVLSDHFSLFAEVQGNFVFPDEAVDNVDANTSYDVLYFLGGGVRFTFAAPFVPVEILSVDAPEMLETGETGTFTADVNVQEATAPIEYIWYFGDGAMAEGLTVTHTYVEPGEYEVTFVASNPESSEEEEMTVEVIAPPEIVAINADPLNPEVGEEVEFSAEVEGTGPFTFEWHFNGDVITDENPTYVFEEPGTHTVTLMVSNEAGTVEETLGLTVAEQFDPCEALTELNTVYFEFDEADLGAEAEELLQENIDALAECPAIDVRVEGYTDQVGPELYNLRLSEQRAQSVEEFYVEQGLAPERINAVGLGEAPVPCLKEDPDVGCRRNRRAESIPVAEGEEMPEAQELPEAEESLETEEPQP